MSQIKVELQDWMGDDRAIAEAAWTSSTTLQSKELKTDADVKRIITQVLTTPILEIEDALKQHATPFESVVFRFWIKMPIAIDRQHMTHRIGSHNGMSGRYRTMPSEYLDISEDIHDILKNAGQLFWPNPTNTDLNPITEYITICERANNSYRAIVEQLRKEEKKGTITNSEFKRCREFFRGMLPQHNMTERVTLFNLRSFANYQKLRNTEYAQAEIKEVARQMLEQVKAANICPIALECLEKNYWII